MVVKLVRSLARVTTLCAALFMSSCIKVVSPVMPSWDVSLTLPLINRTYSISQLVDKDSSLLRSGVGNELSVVTLSDIPPMLIGNSISLSPRNATASMKVGIFDVSVPPLVSTIVLPGLIRGARIPVPDTTFALPVLLDTIPTFESVSLVAGTMTLTLRNNLPVPVDVVAPVYMIDDAGSIVAVFEFDPAAVPPTSSRSVQSSLASKTIGTPSIVGNVMSVTGLVLHLHGSAAPVLIPFGDMMVATITTSGLKARRAVNILLPPQRLTDSDSSLLPLSDSTLIQDLTIRSGIISMTMRSSVDVAMVFKYRFKEIYRQLNGALVPYEDSVALSRSGSATHVVNMATYRIRSSSGTLLSSMEAVGTVIIPISGGQPVSLNDTDKVSIELTSSNPLIVDSAVGVVPPTWLNVTSKVPLALKHLPSNLRAQLLFPSALLSFDTQSGIGFPLDAYVQVSAPTGNGDTVFIQMPAGQRRVQPGPGSVQFDEGEVGRFLSRLSAHLPDSILVGGRILVNPPDVYNPSVAGVGRIGSRSGLAGRMQLRIPMTVGISNGSYCDTVAFGDTTGMGTKAPLPDRSRLNDVNTGKIFLEVQNGTGLQVDVRLGILDAAKQTLLTLPRPGQSVRIEAAQVDDQGNATVPSKGRVVLELTSVDARQFVPAEFFTYSISFVTRPDRPVVKIKTTESVTLRVWSDLSYRME